jgi:hypothetical protein
MASLKRYTEQKHTMQAWKATAQQHHETRIMKRKSFRDLKYMWELRCYLDYMHDACKNHNQLRIVKGAFGALSKKTKKRTMLKAADLYNKKKQLLRFSSQLELCREL